LPQAAHLGRAPMTRALLLLLLCLVSLPPWAAEFSADAVKAAYLFRFASYIEWPESARNDPAFVIGVHGDELVTVHLERLLSGMAVRGKPARVQVVKKPADLKGVHILYVGPRVFRGSREMRDAIRGLPILVVTDHREGLDGGAVINFFEINRNVRFEISVDAAARTGLRIDSALLAVAARVDVRNRK
jgi:hypothetical protein